MSIMDMLRGGKDSEANRNFTAPAEVKAGSMEATEFNLSDFPDVEKMVSQAGEATTESADSIEGMSKQKEDLASLYSAVVN